MLKINVKLFLILLVFSLSITIKINANELNQANKDYEKGVGLYDKGQYNDALIHFNKALKVFREKLGENQKIVADIYNNIGLISRDLGKYDDAFKYFTKSRTITVNTFGTNNESYASTYHNFGALYWDLGKYDVALKFFNDTLKIFRKVVGENNSNTANTYIGIGVINKETGNYNEAIKYYNIALKIYRKTLGEKSLLTALTYTNISEAYCKLNNFNDAFSYVKKGSEIYKSLALNHYLVGSNLQTFGNIYRALKSYKKAIEYYNQALLIYSNTIGNEHRKTAALYSDIGNAYFNLKDYTNAKNYYDKAYKLLIKGVGKDHPASKETEKHLADLYKTTGENNRAINLYQNAASNQRNISVNNTLNARDQVIITSEQALSFSDIAASTSKKTGIFVTEFETQGVDNNIKILIANRITQNIHALGKYAVLERRSLEKVLQQIKLSQSDLFDRTKAPLIGNLVPAKGVVCGNIIKYGNEIAIEARLIKVKSGEIIRNAFVSIKTNDIATITNACQTLTKELMNI